MKQATIVCSYHGYRTFKKVLKLHEVCVISVCNKITIDRKQKI